MYKHYLNKACQLVGKAYNKIKSPIYITASRDHVSAIVLRQWTDFSMTFNRYCDSYCTLEEFNEPSFKAMADFEFINSRFQVLVYRFNEDYIWLSFKNHQNDTLRDWRDFQRIKNELCGTSCEGIEFYPPESRLVDTSNQYHIFVSKPNVSLGIGYMKRDVITTQREVEMIAPKAKQRTFEEHHYSDNVAKIGPLWSMYTLIEQDKETERPVRIYEDILADYYLKNI